MCRDDKNKCLYMTCKKLKHICIKRRPKFWFMEIKRKLLKFTLNHSTIRSEDKTNLIDNTKYLNDENHTVNNPQQKTEQGRRQMSSITKRPEVEVTLNILKTHKSQ